jgi:hypothetical protein
VFNHSVIKLTGQMWKLLLAVIAMLIGSFAPLFPLTGITLTAGAVLAIGAYAYGCYAIVCPACKIRWFWGALMRAEWYKPLLTKSTCPACSHDYDTAQ